jgi:hypothetical protein
VVLSKSQLLKAKERKAEAIKKIVDKLKEDSGLVFSKKQIGK